MGTTRFSPLYFDFYEHLGHIFLVQGCQKTRNPEKTLNLKKKEKIWGNYLGPRMMSYQYLAEIVFLIIILGQKFILYLINTKVK